MVTKKSISRIFSVLFVIVFMLAVTPLQAAYAAGVRYTKPAASGTGDCLSWANACTLQTALTNAASGDEIWVAAGTHKPTTGTDRNATFQLKNGVALYGGFVGTETARDQRNPATNVTTLSGDLNGNDLGFTNNSENVYHVVTGATGATLDGFTITAGNANGIDCPGRECGGGIYNDTSSPTLTNVTITGNSADYGGGMYNYHSSTSLTNVTISGNSASTDGGGIFNYYSDSTFTNVTITGNSSHYVGGGMLTAWCNPTLTNVTVSGNSASMSGGGLYNSSGSPQIHNSIFWMNAATDNSKQIYSNTYVPLVVSDSLVQGGCPAYSTCTNIITAAPLLGVLGDYGGFTQTIPLLPSSSAIDAGNDATCAATDQRGITRPQGAHCDIGAFEVVNSPLPTHVCLPLVAR